MIHLTEAAKEEAQKLLRSKEIGLLRLTVKGGGCAGFTYDMQIVEKEEKSDRIFQFGDVKVACDFQSLPYLSGTTIDYASGLVGAGFTFQNPNASGSCGCGTSFSI